MAHSCPTIIAFEPYSLVQQGKRWDALTLAAGPADIFKTCATTGCAARDAARRCRTTGSGSTVRNDHAPALLRTEYDERSFIVTAEPSVRRYESWLPRGREIATAAQTAVYKSDGLAKKLGLAELWIGFNGWWPERGASLRTATFKELEAFTVLARLSPDENRTLVVGLGR